MDIDQAILDACRDMIDTQGVNAVSVRRLAKAGGCSLRSIYNKFGNLGNVYRSLVNAFTTEIGEYILERSAGRVETDEGLHAVHALFVSYFLEYPNRFFFMYLYKHDTLDGERMLFDTDEFQERMRESFRYLTATRTISDREIDNLRRRILYGAFGLLTFYVTENFGLTSDQVLSEFRSFFFAQLAVLR